MCKSKNKNKTLRTMPGPLQAIDKLLSPDFPSTQAAHERRGPFKGHAHFGNKRKYALRSPGVTSESRK